MKMSQLEIYLGRPQLVGHPTPAILASIHRGDAFTRVFSLTLIALIWVSGPMTLLAWFGSWAYIYDELERWGLVLAFVDQFFLLTASYFLLQITYLRAGHLRQIPQGQFVILQAAALILRWLGECILISTLATLGHSLLAAQGSDWISSILSGFGPTVAQGDVTVATKFLSIATSGWLQIIGFSSFALLYTLASRIELLITIEWNTRDKKVSLSKDGNLSGHGREVQPNRDNASTSA